VHSLSWSEIGAAMQPAAILLLVKGTTFLDRVLLWLVLEDPGEGWGAG
jgi:hypothetical protein